MPQPRTQEQLREVITAAIDDEDPAFLSPTELELLSVVDVPDGAAISVGVLKDSVHHIEWDGELHVEDGSVVAYARQLNTRKYWYSPVGLFHYMDLLRRAIETRARTIGDVAFDEFEDDGAYIHLRYEVRLGKPPNLRTAYCGFQKF